MKPKRPPCALMTATAAMQEDCAVLKKLADAGLEIVVVPDEDFEQALKTLGKVRLETKSKFQETWHCKRCDQDVDTLRMRCGCADSPSPWELV